MSLSRRKFLKGSVVAVAGVAAGAVIPAEAEAKAQKWDMTADVIVVGFGGAGGCAAIEAHDHKAKVLIIEKQPEVTHYPNTRMSGGGFHCPDPEGQKDAIAAFARALFSGDNIKGKYEPEMDPEIAQRLAEYWAEYTPKNVEWLKSLDPEFNPKKNGGASFKDFPGVDKAGYRRYSASYIGKADFDVPTLHAPKNQKMAGEAMFTCIKTGVEKRKINVLYDTPAKQLLTDEKGDVIGVLAERNGKEIRCKAKKAVVLTSGGYEYNAEMRKAFLEGPGIDGWAFYGSPHNTGDGIVMASAIGAGLAKVGKAAARLIGVAPKRYHGMRMGLMSGVVGGKGSIVVDNLGKRYFPETMVVEDPSRYFFYKEAVHMDLNTLDYPRIPSWMIFDENFRTSKTITYRGVSIVGFDFIEWDADNSNAIKNGWIVKGNTLKELAENILKEHDNHEKMSVEDLETTVARFNAFCEKGKDDDFDRRKSTLAPITTPPFYAMALYPGGPNTKGGIKANSERQVLRWDNTPIGRLYTAGEISSALKYVYQGGANITECIVFGRVAGKNAAAEKSRS